MLPLIIVRPEPGASATAHRARQQGLAVRVMPLFEIAPLAAPQPDPDAYDALLLTSANAVRHAGTLLASFRHLPCHAVGTATAAAARAAGLNLVAVGQGGAQPLVDAAVVEGARAILWLCGADRMPLDGGAARITPLPVYDAAAIPPPEGWAAAIADPAVLLLHSARAAAHAATLVGAARNHLIALAISPAVANAAGGGWAETHISAAPTDGAMLASARALCHRARK